MLKIEFSSYPSFLRDYFFKALFCSLAIFAIIYLFWQEKNSEMLRPEYNSTISSKNLLQIDGDVVNSGVYDLSDNKLSDIAINLAKLSKEIDREEIDKLNSLNLKSGDAIKIKIDNRKLYIIQTRIEPAKRITLGIPLVISDMKESDFELLPKIGPKMARKIVEYRQKNGEKMTVDDLKNVDGIGEKMFVELEKYFK